MWCTTGFTRLAVRQHAIPRRRARACMQRVRCERGLMGVEARVGLCLEWRWLHSPSAAASTGQGMLCGPSLSLKDGQLYAAWLLCWLQVLDTGSMMASFLKGGK